MTGPRCRQCWAPSHQLILRSNRWICRDCADLNQAATEPHPFGYAASNMGKTCFRCGLERENKIHRGDAVLPPATQFINLMGDK